MEVVEFRPASFRWMGMISLLPLMLAVLSVPCLARPVYPVMALGGDHSHNSSIPVPTTADMQLIAESFTYLHGEYSTQQLQLMHKTRPEFAVVRYINSHIANAQDIESTPGGRLSTIFYCTGWLAESVSATDTELTILLDTRFSPLVASTAKGNMSTVDSFVTYLRINDELLKVLSVSKLHAVDLDGANSANQTVEVVRGFDGTRGQEYDKNTTVFSPSYKNYPGQTWQDISSAKTSPITYDVDPASNYAHQMLSQFTVAAVQMGYNGSWFDCFSSGVLKATDVGGRPIKGFRFWNFAANTEYTKDMYVQAQHRRLQTVFDVTRQALGFYPTVLANNVAGFYFDGGKSFLETEAGLRPLDAYDHESFGGSLSTTNPDVNSCTGPPGDFTLKYHPLDQWLGNVQQVMDASQSNVSLIAMMASAGCQAFVMEGLGERRTHFQRFAYASYLLGVASPTARTLFGVPAYYQANGTRYVHLDDWLSVEIGVPEESYPYKDVMKYQPPGHSSFVRKFSKGIVVVNPSNSTDNAVPLPGSYYHIPSTMGEAQTETSLHGSLKPANTVDIEPHTGLLMLNDLQ